MNTRRTTLLAAALLSVLTSCGDSQNAVNTPIDSTNVNGTAPADYTEGGTNPQLDTSSARHDAYVRDTVTASQRTLPQNMPQGRGANTSNTTDQRTTSGSANNGDADKDRKK